MDAADSTEATTVFKQHSTKKKIIAYLLFILLAVMMVWAGRWMVADIYAYQAKRYLMRWQEVAQITDYEDIERAQQLINTALLLDKKNPKFMMYAARIDEWHAVQSVKRLSSDDKKRVLEHALLLYRDSAAVQPAWPFTWVALATIKNRLHEYDDEFFHALERATTLGSWEGTIQWRVAKLGFSASEYLPDATNALLAANFQRGLYSNHYRSKLILLAKENNYFTRFCMGRVNDVKYPEKIESIVQKECNAALKIL